MAQEIERKFLVRDDSFRQLAYAHSHIAQGYIVADSGRTVRIRLRGDHGYITIKGPSRDGGLSRYEFETEIDADEARQLMRLCEPGVVEKERYLVRTDDGHTVEVDVFEGSNAGLVMAEIELQRDDEPFERPAFLGREVTGDRRFYNSHLRRYPYCIWRDEVE